MESTGQEGGRELTVFSPAFACIFIPSDYLIMNFAMYFSYSMLIAKSKHALVGGKDEVSPFQS